LALASASVTPRALAIMGLFRVVAVAAVATAVANAAVATPAAANSVVEKRNPAALTTRRAEVKPVVTPVSCLPSWRGGGAPNKLRGAVSMGGGVLAHLVLGTMYCWANFISYAPESILYFNGLSAEANGGASPDALQMMPVTLAFLCVGLKLGGMLMKTVIKLTQTRIGTRISGPGPSHGLTHPSSLKAHTMHHSIPRLLARPSPHVGDWMCPRSKRRLRRLIPDPLNSLHALLLMHRRWVVLPVYLHRTTCTYSHVVTTTTTSSPRSPTQPV